MVILPVARAADNGGCAPPQIPRSKQLKLKRLQAVSNRTRIEPLSSRETWFAASLLVQCASRTAGSRSSRSGAFCAFASMGECPVAVLWVRRSETNRLSKCLQDTRGELARKSLSHRRMSNDSPKIKWPCQRVNEQVGVGIRRQFSGRDGLLDQV
jgi:hypothetical protein